MKGNFQVRFLGGAGAVRLPSYPVIHIVHVLYQFQIKDDLKAAMIEAARHTDKYVERPKTSRRREGFDMELELTPFSSSHFRVEATAPLSVSGEGCGR